MIYLIPQGSLSGDPEGEKKDFKLYPSEENNYDFQQADDYIASLIYTGADIVYRLGENIEHKQNKYYVNPPMDNEKWAAICCGIIRH